jgi:hypothetical protein
MNGANARKEFEFFMGRLRMAIKTKFLLRKAMTAMYEDALDQ